MKKMSKGMLMTALICGAVYLGGSPVNANELQEFSLDEYVVTAARTETKLVDTPANISVVDAQTIEERHYQDVSEVLKDVPGATVLDTGVGTCEKVIRLNGDERVLILVDGRRVGTDMGLTNSQRASMDMNQLPDVTLIERIEVLKGAGGALYGSDAVGGVVNIITKKADSNFGKVSLGFGSHDTRDMSAFYSFKEGKTGVVVSGAKNKQGYYEFNDYKTDKSKKYPYPSNYENEKVSLKVQQDFDESKRLTVGYDYSEYNGMSPSVYGVNYQDKESNNLYGKFDWNVNADNTGYLQIYYNKLDYKNKGVEVSDPWYTLADGNLQEKTTGIDFQQNISVADNNTIITGVSWRKAEVISFGDNDYNENIDNLAVFINNTWELHPCWTLNTGVRYDDHSEVGDETTLSAGLNKKFNDYSHVYINWGQVFKAPTTDDLFWDSEMGGYYTLGNRNLVAETGETWTVGYNTKINNKTDIGLSYFESKLDDAISWEYTDDTFLTMQATNIDKQKKRGLELSFNHELNDNVEINASYTYLKVENDKSNYVGFERDGNVIPNMYRVGINYTDRKWDSNLIIRYGTGAADTYISNWGPANAYLDSKYLTVDLAITYNADKNIKIFAKGYNLLNEAYAEYGGHDDVDYKYPAQSRRFIVGAEYKF